MDGLVKRTRVKFAGLGQEDASSRGQIPPQKTQSFNGGRKPQQWFGRQFTTQMSSSNDYSDGGEYAAAVAAAAFAINSLDSNISDQRERTAVPETSLEKIRSKKRDMSTMPEESGSMSKRFTDEAAVEFADKPDELKSEGSDIDGLMPRKSIHPVPSIKRTPTFPNKQLESKQNMKTESIEPKPVLPSPIPPPPLVVQPVFPPKETETPEIQETETDKWERDELAKIKQRYDKLKTTIVAWEDSNKKKAKRKLEKVERELQLRRAKAMRDYQIEMDRINQIVEGARAQAKERQRNEELKVQKKANKFRATGELPRCLCF